MRAALLLNLRRIVAMSGNAAGSSTAQGVIEERIPVAAIMGGGFMPAGGLRKRRIALSGCITATSHAAGAMVTIAEVVGVSHAKATSCGASNVDDHFSKLLHQEDEEWLLAA